jgi:hypothetical protein
MVWPKRARTAETPTQPSPDLRLRAPYFYPDRAFASLSLARSGGTNLMCKEIGRLLWVQAV